MSALTAVAQELKQAESNIENNIMAAGKELLRIRDEKLYREGYKTFEVYCEHRWKFTKRRANQLIAAIDVIENLGTKVPIPEGERVVRPLVKLEPEKQKKVWSEAVKSANGKQPTAKQVEAAVASQSVPDDAFESPEAIKDPAGYVVPEKAVAAMEFAPALKTWCRTLDTMKREILEAVESQKPGTRYILLPTVTELTRQLKQTLWASIPEYVCPYCDGEGKTDRHGQCKPCEGEGWVNGGAYYAGKSQRTVSK